MYFIVGPPKINNSAQSTQTKVNSAVSSYGKVSPLNVGQAQ